MGTFKYHLRRHLWATAVHLGRHWKARAYGTHPPTESAMTFNPPRAPAPLPRPHRWARIHFRRAMKTFIVSRMMDINPVKVHQRHVSLSFRDLPRLGRRHLLCRHLRMIAAVLRMMEIPASHRYRRSNENRPRRHRRPLLMKPVDRAPSGSAPCAGAPARAPTRTPSQPRLWEAGWGCGPVP